MPESLLPRAELVSTTVRLADDQLELLADLIAERLRDGHEPDVGLVVLVDAAEIARRFGLTPATVRARADEFGVIRLGEGPKPRLRFDPAKVAVALTDCQAGRSPEPAEVPAQPTLRRRRRARRTGTGTELLPRRGTQTSRRTA